MTNVAIGVVGIFNSTFGRFYTARNPVQFWSRWNPCRVKHSVLIYKWLRKRIGSWIKIPFTIFIFAFWGFTDDLGWLLLSFIVGFEIFPFGFWTVAIGVQSFVVIVWKQLPKWLPRLPGVIAIPATQIYVVVSIALVTNYIF